MLILLTPLERLILEHLPGEPNGLSLQELADGLLDDRSPQARGRVRAALDNLARMLGGLAVRRGDDDFGQADVELYGLPRDTGHLVRRIFRPDPPTNRPTCADTPP